MYQQNPHAHLTDSGFIRYDATKKWNPKSTDSTVYNFCAFIRQRPLDIEGCLFPIEEECMVGTIYIQHAGKDIWMTPNWENADYEDAPGIAVAICDTETGDPLHWGYMRAEFTGDCYRDDILFREIVLQYIADHSDLLVD